MVHKILAKYYLNKNKKLSFIIFQKAIKLSIKNNDIFGYLTTLIEYAYIVPKSFKKREMLRELRFAMKIIENTDFKAYKDRIKKLIKKFYAPYLESLPE